MASHHTLREIELTEPGYLGAAECIVREGKAREPHVGSNDGGCAVATEVVARRLVTAGNRQRLLDHDVPDFDSALRAKTENAKASGPSDPYAIPREPSASLDLNAAAEGTRLQRCHRIYAVDLEIGHLKVRPRIAH